LNDFSSFVGRTKKAVLGAIRASLHPDLSHAIDDVAQDAYVRLYKSWKKGGIRLETETSYAYTVTKNECIRWNLKNKKERLIADELSQRRETTQSEEFDDSIVKELLPGIPEPFRETLRLLLDGKSVREIARKLKVAEGTVKSRIHRAKEMLLRNANAKRQKELI